MDFTTGLAVGAALGSTAQTAGTNCNSSIAIAVLLICALWFWWCWR